MNELYWFTYADIPRMEQEKAGFSIYRGTLVKWDEDFDQRVLTIIDWMPQKVRENLAIIQEHENCLSLVWRDTVPKGYETGTKLLLKNHPEHFLIYDSRQIGVEPFDYWDQFPQEEEESWQSE